MSKVKLLFVVTRACCRRARPRTFTPRSIHDPFNSKVLSGVRLQVLLAIPEPKEMALRYLIDPADDKEASENASLCLLLT
jgi:hypothetical protein